MQAKAGKALSKIEPTIGGSVYVKPNDIKWEPTQFEGISIKVLYEDKAKGEMTCLLKWDGVTGRNEQRFAVRADATWRPNTAAPCACGPARHNLRIMQGNTDNPAMVIAAIAEMTAKRHEEHTIDYCKGSALALITWIEGLAVSCERSRHVNWPAWQE